MPFSFFCSQTSCSVSVFFFTGLLPFSLAALLFNLTEIAPSSLQFNHFKCEAMCKALQDE